MSEPDSSQAPSSRGLWQTWKWRVYTSTCYAFHVILVLIHVVLLALHKFGREESVVVPSSISNDVASVGVTVILQTFGTVYGILLVWLTQRLALRRDLLQRQTLTATHDKSGAWSGLGAALHTLWEETKLNAAACGVLLVALYLGGIAILHVTSCSLLSLVPFDNTHVESAPTQYGMLNLTDLPLDSYWNTATALIRSIAGYPELQTIGLTGATLYETLPDRSGYGNATVNAVTFGAQCYSLSNVSAVLNPSGNGSYTVSVTDGTQPPVSYSPIYGLYENVTYEVYAYGKAVTILASPPMLDANLDSGTTFNITQTHPASDGSNVTETITIQAMTCVLSLTDQVAIINASTNALLSIDPTPPPLSSTWTPWQVNATGDPDPQLDWLGDAWNLSAISTDFYGPTHCEEQECLLSFLDEYLMALLGLQYNATALNQTAVSTSSNTLIDLETSVAQVASAAAWAVLTTSGYYTNSTGDTSVVKSDFKLRLNINLTPVSVGLFGSVLLLALSSSLIRSLGVDEQHTVDSCGILQVIWLSSRHDTIQKAVAKAGSSSFELRKVGLGCTTTFGAGSSDKDEVKVAEGSNTLEGKC